MLELDHLSRRFGDVVALDDVSFTVAPGELRGFLGPNGAGKTTAMRAVMGITAPDRGEVRWDGRRLVREDRLRFGYMPEERGLYPKMAVREQLVYFGRLHGMDKDQAGEDADGWIERVGLSDRADDNLEDLSLGNQQRVQLAAALIHRPEVLILDEPFAGFDPLAVDIMSDIVRERAADGVAVLFSSHQLDLVEHLCQTVAVVDRGRLVLQGEVRDLKRGGRRRLRVGVEGPDDTWTSAVAEVEILERRPDGTVVVALDDHDPAAVLEAAQGAGRLTHFSLDEPSLSELFRDAVGRRVDA